MEGTVFNGVTLCTPKGPSWLTEDAAFRMFNPGLIEQNEAAVFTGVNLLCTPKAGAAKAPVG